MMPYNHCFFERPLEVFDPFSLYFWDNFPSAFPPPPLMMPPCPIFRDMGRLVPRTKIEHTETPEAHYFKAELPGIRKEDVNVKVEENGKMLHISAKKKHDKEEKKDNYHHVEHSYGEFVSRFTLPPNSQPENLRIHVHDGVLTVTIPMHKVHNNHNYDHNYNY